MPRHLRRQSAQVSLQYILPPQQIIRRNRKQVRYPDQHINRRLDVAVFPVGNKPVSETPSFFASDTCVYPCRILSSCMRSLKIATLSLVVKFNDTIIK